jgi:ribosomal-protein-alanine N-acetyltransferase
MEIEKVSFGTHHWSSDSFHSEIDNELGNYFTAINKDTNNVIGYGGYWLIFDEAHITTIAVDPKLRKNKIGEIILQHMITVGYEKKAKWFTLEVRAGNIPAQNLYKKYGFESLGVRKKYYQDNDEDALIMWTENIWDSKFKNKFQELKIGRDPQNTVNTSF